MKYSDAIKVGADCETAPVTKRKKSSNMVSNYSPFYSQAGLRHGRRTALQDSRCVSYCYISTAESAAYTYRYDHIAEAAPPPPCAEAGSPATRFASSSPPPPIRACDPPQYFSNSAVT